MNKMPSEALAKSQIGKVQTSIILVVPAIYPLLLSETKLWEETLHTIDDVIRRTS